MSFEYCLESESFVASGDLSLLQHRIVSVIGPFKVGVSGVGDGYGILQNKPRDAEHAQVGTEGVSMVRVGAAVNAGSLATSAASGWAVQTAPTSGTSQKVIGTFLTSAASGMLASVKIDRSLVVAFA